MQVSKLEMGVSGTLYACNVTNKTNCAPFFQNTGAGNVGDVEETVKEASPIRK